MTALFRGARQRRGLAEVRCSAVLANMNAKLTLPLFALVPLLIGCSRSSNVFTTQSGATVRLGAVVIDGANVTMTNILVR